jgi:protein-arginine kinase activator protein McsA
VVPISSLAEQQPDLRTRLQRELDFAVEQENYEEAARIRDRLNSL